MSSNWSFLFVIKPIQKQPLSLLNILFGNPAKISIKISEVPIRSHFNHYFKVLYLEVFDNKRKDSSLDNTKPLVKNIL